MGDWITLNGGITYKLHVDRRLRFSITYLGRGRGCGPMRWKVQDHSQVEGLNDIPEFSSLDEAKAWVVTVVRLS
jgi:hypothetical protein